MKLILTSASERVVSQSMQPTRSVFDNREVKLDVYGKRQTAKIKLLLSVFSYYINHTKNRKVSLTIHCKYKSFDSTVQRAEDRRQKFYFCRLPFAINVKLNLSVVKNTP